MKDLAFIAILFFCGCSSGVLPSRERDIVGWGGVPWATSRDKASSIVLQEILSHRYSQIGPWPGPPNELSVIFKIQTYGYIAKTTFSNAAGLERVVVAPNLENFDSNPDHLFWSPQYKEYEENSFKLLMEGMTNKYGIPVEYQKMKSIAWLGTSATNVVPNDDIGCDEKIWTWQREHGSASLEYCLVRKPTDPFLSYPIVRLLYMKREILPEL